MKKLKTLILAALAVGGACAAFGSGSFIEAEGPFGSEENPWKVGYPNEGDVVAYTNGTGTLVIEGTGDTWPDFLEKVPGWAYVADQITSVEIGEGVTSLGASAFDPFDPEISYQLLASVKFPSTLKSIGDCAFMLCSLADVTIPASVTNIGVMAFGGEGQGKEPPTPTLKSVTVLATVPPALGALAFASYADGFKINVPEGTAEAYKAAPGWMKYKDNIGGGAIDVASLYPDGDGAFVPATKATTHYGSLIGEDGVAGTITVKMTKPNMKGQFNLSATVNTLAGKQNYSFKASKVTVADAVTNANGALTFALVGSNKKAKAHTLAVTFGGDSLKGAFDGFAIDGARHVFSTSREPKREAVKPFAGTWTGSFADGVIAFSAKLAKNGNASVKVVLPDGTTVSSTAKAEVGAGGVIAVPVTVWKSLKAGALTFGFRLAFGAVDGKFVCQAADVSPLKMTDKRTGAVIASEAVKFDEAGLQTVTAKEFKTFAVALPEELTQEFGQPTRIALKMASTGLISGTVKFDKGSAKASGIVVNGKGVGLLTIKQDKVERAFVFSAKPAK